MFKKYKWNFILTVFSISIIGFTVFDFIFYHILKTYLFNQTFDEMRMKTRLAVTLLEQKKLHPLENYTEDLFDVTNQLRAIVNSRITIIDPTGHVLTDSDMRKEDVPAMDNHIDRPEIKQVRAKGWGQSYRKSDTINRKLFYTAFPLNSNGNTLGYLRLAYYAKNFEHSMVKIMTYIIGASIIGLIILPVVAYLLAPVVTFPILRIVSIAQEISAGDLNKSFPVRRRDEIGTLALILNQLTDRLKNQIIQISNERTKLQDILSNLDIGIFVVNQDRYILHANPVILQMLQITNGNIEHKHIANILQPESLIDAVDAVLTENNKRTGEFSYYIDSDKIFISYVITPFYIAEEKQTGALIQLQNVTELKTLEAIRRDFVANASHELKTPLTSILGYTETLLGGAHEDVSCRLRFIRRIREQSLRLELLVADLLKLSQVEQDLPIEFTNVRLLPLILETVEEFSEKFNQKNIKIQTEISDNSIQIKADEELLRIVLSNLVDNAIKYSHENSLITIRITEPDKDLVKIEIIDSGIGISARYHDRIFQRFYRVDKARSRALGGTGLGLSIVKHIIENHGSKVQVTSELGKGSNFFFTLEKAVDILGSTGAAPKKPSLKQPGESRSK